MRNLKEIFNTENPNTQLDIAMESLIDGDSGPAFDHCIELLFQEFRKFPQTVAPLRLYRFVGIPSKGEGREAIMTDISSNRITLGNPDKFNDPMDPILREWLKLQISETKGKERKLFQMLRNLLKRLRICSLSGCQKSNGLLSFGSHRSPQEPYLNPLMWPHYANSHKGICIEYEITQQNLEEYNNSNELLRLLPVSYRQQKPMTDYITLDNAIRAKASCWKYEEEVRLVYFGKDMSKWIKPDWRNESQQDGENPQKYKDYISLDGFNVKAIYFGSKISDKDKSEVVNKLHNNRGNVNLFQMKFRRDDITQLEANQL